MQIPHALCEGAKRMTLCPIGAVFLQEGLSSRSHDGYLFCRIDLDLVWIKVVRKGIEIEIIQM